MERFDYYGEAQKCSEKAGLLAYEGKHKEAFEQMGYAYNYMKYFQYLCSRGI